MARALSAGRVLGNKPRSNERLLTATTFPAMKVFAEGSTTMHQAMLNTAGRYGARALTDRPATLTVAGSLCAPNNGYSGAASDKSLFVLRACLLRSWTLQTGRSEVTTCSPVATRLGNNDLDLSLRNLDGAKKTGKSEQQIIDERQLVDFTASPHLPIRTERFYLHQQGRCAAASSLPAGKAVAVVRNSGASVTRRQKRRFRTILPRWPYTP